MKTNRNLSLLPFIFLVLITPIYGQSQTDCNNDVESPFCMVKKVAIKGDETTGGAKVKFPRIAYDKCSEIRVIDYYVVTEELKVETGHFLACGSHEMQTFVVDSKGNYSICEFTVVINCSSGKTDGER